MRLLPLGTLGLLALLAPFGVELYAQETAARPIDASTALDTALSPGAVHSFSLSLERGESANLIVTQMGVDVVVDVRAPGGTLLDSFDSPNGRQGDEPVEIIAEESGPYLIQVRPIDVREPEGKYRLRVIERRDTRATAALQATRKARRDSAAAWLRPRSIAIPNDGVVSSTGTLSSLDALARRARVIGFGEATHGSREFGNFRVAMTRRLVERFGYRVVAIEASTDKLAYRNASIHRSPAEPLGVRRAVDQPDVRPADGSWIGTRAQDELVRWLREWNAAHPRDRVTLVGVDPQLNSAAQLRLAAFLEQAYGPATGKAWAPVARELLAADSQVVVFGDSYVSAPTREALFEMLARLDLDAPLLRARLGAAVDTARVTVRQLAEFADFNGEDGWTTVQGHGRDWYMAARVLDALRTAGPHAKAVYWAHNAHVCAPPGRPLANRSSGALLRDALGCGYAALGMTFGAGSFVAQIPNDIDDRLQVSALPQSPDESVDGVLSTLRAGASATTWGCGTAVDSTPRWLKESHPMHWVGGLFAPGTLPSSAFRPYDLVRDFDGIVYFPRVSAEALPPARPRVPARVR